MIIKVMILGLIAAFVGLFFVDGPSGEPILKLPDLNPETAELLNTPGEPIRVYKWKDENGIWQFSGEPVEGEHVEVMELDGKINTIPAVSVAADKAGGVQGSASGLPATPHGLTSVSPDKIAEMMDSVNNMQETVDGRKALVDKNTGVKN
ncbi:MAG: hypothetical protein ABGY96_29295 [bacterium]|nr:hypothetical protein [Gammaproteobacteria bacterium]HIL98936.1 hypothetical protein [Pseudomonadales bacterium]